MEKDKFVVIMFFVFVAVFLGGCATSGKKINRNKVQQIEEGITTRQEVIELLGKPNITNLTSDGKIIMTYYYAKIKNRATNFIPGVNLLAGGADMQQQILQIIIDEDGIVEKYLLTDSNTPINSGVLNTE